MLWLIAKKDFLLNLISARFITGFLLCLVIIPFTVVVNVDNYLSQVEIYKIEKEKADKEFNEIRVWSMLRPTVVKEPEVLSIFSNGISGNLGNKNEIKLREYPLFPSGHIITRDNPLLNAFFSIDFSKVIAILISLIALVFSYDAITREREDGTMKQSFTGNVSRITFLFGKITGLLLTLLPILLFCYILACLIVLLNPGIAISAADWVGILLLFFTSIIYMLVFILIGMLISALTARSSTSIILSLLCWIWFLFLLPNIAAYLSQSIVKTPLYDNIQNVFTEYDKDFRKDYDEADERVKNEFNVIYFNCGICGFYGDGSKRFLGITKETALAQRDLSIWESSILQNYADKKWTIQKNYLDELVRQEEWQQRIAWLSPSGIFGQTTNALCRTDMQSFLKYLENVRNYRETFIRYYSDKKLFESLAYFIPESFENLPTEEELRSLGQDHWDWLVEKGRMLETFPYLNTEDIPRFVSQSVTLELAINGAMSRLTALFALMAALLLATIATFMRYDVR